MPTDGRWVLTQCWKS